MSASITYNVLYNCMLNNIIQENHNMKSTLNNAKP